MDVAYYLNVSCVLFLLYYMFMVSSVIFDYFSCTFIEEK